METKLAVLLFSACLVTIAGNKPRFQADKFLDMLSRSYDPSVAYVDLLNELTQRLKIDLNVNVTTGSKIALASTNMPCPDAPKMNGASITYNSDIHIAGSRAFYECDTGYDGMSKFIYCTQGGQWSTFGDWEGCSPVDCGLILPNVQNADPSFTSTTYGSIVLYSCHAGYKMDKPYANVTCQDTGFWEKPTFACEKASSPSLRLPSLQKAFNKNIGVQKIQQLQQLATTLLEAGPSSNPKPQPSPSRTQAVAPRGNPMMEAFFKSMQSTFQAPPGAPDAGSAANSPPAAPANPFANNPMFAMFAQMFPNFSPPTAAPTTTTTTTTAKPVIQAPAGFQLPTHLQSLLPNGLSSTAGIKPQDLMTLASMGLGSSSSGAAPKDISQLLGTMNPMSMFGGGMGLGLGGFGGRLGGTGTGPGTPPPIEPEKMVEQREEMMMRAMMASAMKSMMSPGGSRNSTANRSPAADMMTLMALQSGLSGGGSGSSGSGGFGAMDPFSMMMSGMGGGGGSSGGLFGSLFA